MNLVLRDGSLSSLLGGVRPLLQQGFASCVNFRKYERSVRHCCHSCRFCRVSSSLLSVASLISRVLSSGYRDLTVFIVLDDERALYSTFMLDYLRSLYALVIQSYSCYKVERGACRSSDTVGVLNPNTHNLTILPLHDWRRLLECGSPGCVFGSGGPARYLFVDDCEFMFDEFYGHLRPCDATHTPGCVAESECDDTPLSPSCACPDGGAGWARRFDPRPGSGACTIRSADSLRCAEGAADGVVECASPVSDPPYGDFADCPGPAGGVGVVAASVVATAGAACSACPDYGSDRIDTVTTTNGAWSSSSGDIDPHDDLCMSGVEFDTDLEGSPPGSGSEGPQPCLRSRSVLECGAMPSLLRKARTWRSSKQRSAVSRICEVDCLALYEQCEDGSSAGDVLFFDNVMCCGTFDCLHFGHKYLLLLAFLSCRRLLRIGITASDAMLHKKSDFLLIQSFDKRRDAVESYVRMLESLYCGRCVGVSTLAAQFANGSRVINYHNCDFFSYHTDPLELPEGATLSFREFCAGCAPAASAAVVGACADPAVSVTTFQLMDTYGPAAVHNDTFALVISPESLPGAERVNDFRRSKGLRGWPLLSAGFVLHPELNRPRKVVTKVSSSRIRSGLKSMS